MRHSLRPADRTREIDENRASAKNEASRLAALQCYQILDTGPEDSFDDLTALAAQICDAPIALVSLIDANRQWFKSRVGVEAAETSRDIAFAPTPSSNRIFSSCRMPRETIDSPTIPW